MIQSTPSDSLNLAVIPARGGSKGIKNKNIMQVGSKTLIEHAICAAKSSTLLTDIIVTSDNPKILELSTQYCISTRDRPISLAQDDSSVVTALQDAVNTMETINKCVYDNIILLQPTSPIRTGDDIDNVINIMTQYPDVEGVISVSDCGVFLPDHQYYIEKDGENGVDALRPFTDENNQRKRRQDITQSYVRNGAIYSARRSILMHQNKIIVDHKVPYIMPKKYICNLDDYEDLELARIIVPAWESGLL
tara:strand:+ start:3877 stop:4623 length:747 start_codon:yes stop_codon:yes gene_type:complete